MAVFNIGTGVVDIKTDGPSRSSIRRDAENAAGGWASRFTGMLKTRLLSGLQGVVTKVLPALGAGLNVFLVAAPWIAKAASATWEFVSAAVAAAPALIALGSAGFIALKIIKGFGPAFAKAFTPVTDALQRAEDHAARLATKGLRPLAAEFVKINMPAISSAMDRIGVATNKVVTRFMEWTTTAEGVKSIRSIMGGVATLVERVGPMVSAVATSFVAMLGRIMDVSVAAGSAGLSGVLMRVKDWLDGITAQSVQNGLDRLSTAFHNIASGIGAVVGWVQTGIGIWQKYHAQIMVIADALGILAIVFGGPVTAAIAAVGLIIRHWDKLKAAGQAIKDWFTQNPVGAGFLSNLQSAAQTILPALQGAFTTFWSIVQPPLKSLWNAIAGPGGLIEALGQFLAAAAPFVAWFLEKFGPIIGNAVAGVLQVIKGFVQILTGIFQVLTAILTGNWSKAWDGIKNILKGALNIVVGLIRAVPGTILKILGALLSGMLRVFDNIGTGINSRVRSMIGTAVGWFAGLPGRVIGAVAGLVGSLGSLMSRAGTAMNQRITSAISTAVRWFQGLPGRIRSALGSVRSAVTGAFSGAGGWLVSAGRSVIQGFINGIRNMFGSVRSTLGNLTSSLTSWKGPESVDRKLLTGTGQTVIDGFIKGLESRYGMVARTLQGLTTDIPVTVSRGTTGGQGASATSTGSRSITIGNLTLKLEVPAGVTNPEEWSRKAIAALYDLLAKYERSYA